MYLYIFIFILHIYSINIYICMYHSKNKKIVKIKIEEKNRVRNKKVTPSNKLENCQSGERKKVSKKPIWAAFGFLLHLYCCFDGSVKRKQSNIVFSIKFSFLFKNVSIYKSLGSSLLLHSM